MPHTESLLLPLHVWQPYLQVIVEEVPHALEAASGQLVLLQPAQSAAHVLLVDVNVRAGLSKGPGYKSCQPVSRARGIPCHSQEMNQQG